MIKAKVESEEDARGSQPEIPFFSSSSRYNDLEGLTSFFSFSNYSPSYIRAARSNTRECTLAASTPAHASPPHSPPVLFLKAFTDATRSSGRCEEERERDFVVFGKREGGADIPSLWIKKKTRDQNKLLVLHVLHERMHYVTRRELSGIKKTNEALRRVQTGGKQVDYFQERRLMDGKQSAWRILDGWCRRGRSGHDTGYGFTLQLKPSGSARSPFGGRGGRIWSGSWLPSLTRGGGTEHMTTGWI